MAPQFAWGFEPFTAGALIPDALAKDFLRGWLDDGQKRVKDLADLGRERLARIPTDCFMDGQLAAAHARIEELEHQLAEDAKHKAYLETLDPDLHRHRRVVLNTGDNRRLSEDDLIAAAEFSLQREREEDERRKSKARRSGCACA